MMNLNSNRLLHVPMLVSVARSLRSYRPGLGAGIPIQLSVDQPIMMVGKTAHFRILGAPPNQPIYWSSYKNGAATGELNAGYGDRTAANGTADLAFTPRAEDVGAWVKEVLVQDAAGNNYTAMVTFSVQGAAAGAPAGSAGGAVAPKSAAPAGGFFDQLTSGGFTVGGIFIPYIAAIAVGGVGLLVLSKRR